MISRQLLSILVLDLGYKGRPLHGHDPIRHQLAWSMCEDDLGEDFQNTMDEMIKHADWSLPGVYKYNLKESISRQLLSILVLDLGYIIPPIYSSGPIRHQVAWGMCEDAIGEDFQNTLDDMIEHGEKEQNRKRKIEDKDFDVIKQFIVETEENHERTLHFGVYPGLHIRMTVDTVPQTKPDRGFKILKFPDAYKCHVVDAHPAGAKIDVIRAEAEIVEEPEKKEFKLPRYDF